MREAERRRRNARLRKRRIARARRQKRTFLCIVALMLVGLVAGVIDIAAHPLKIDSDQEQTSVSDENNAQTAVAYGAPAQITAGPEPSFLPTPSPAPTLAPTPSPTPVIVAVAPTIAPMEQPTPEPTLRSVRVRAVGDLMVHERQLEIALQQDGSYDFHPQYELITDSLADADYTIGNLETTIGKYKDEPYSGYPRFNTPESLLETLRDAGVDFLTLANNHMLDRYFDGMVATVNSVEQYGFAHGGANRTPEEQDTPKIVEINGIRLGMLCYTQLTNGMEFSCDPAVFDYGVNYLDRADVEADVAALRSAGADIVIAMPHWGQEYKREPEVYTIDFARRMVAAGVDVILGSHPHMVQPVEYVSAETSEGETRTGLVAYSLGNFISNMKIQYTDSGIILDFTIRETQEGGFTVDNVGCVPVFCWRQDDMIQSLSSLKYYDERPEGMSDARYSRMRESYTELRQLIGEEIEMLAE